MATTVKVSVKAQSVIALLKGFRVKFRNVLWQKLDKISLEVQRSVKEDKLSGQVLSVRTGTLRRSINRRVEEYGGGLRAVVGTNVAYAPAHEYGFNGVVTVREHMRLGKFLVRAHKRTMHLPERSFLRSVLKEQMPKAREELKAAAMEVLKK